MGELHQPGSNEHRIIAGLLRAGVSMADCGRLLEACDESPQRVLVLVVLPEGLEVGDSIRAVTVAGRPPQAMRVVDLVKGVPVPQRDQSIRWRWAVVGDPVAPSSRDVTQVEPDGGAR